MSRTKRINKKTTKSKASADNRVKVSLNRKAKTGKKAIDSSENKKTVDTPVKNMASLWSSALQAKLTIGKPGGKLEKEADAVADKVVNNTNSGRASENSKFAISKKESTQTKLIQQQTEEKEEPTQAKLIQRQVEEKEEPAQAKLLQRQEEEKEEVTQAKLIQPQGEEKEEPAQTKFLQRQEDEKEESPQAKLIQKQEDEKEEPGQAKFLQQQTEEKEEPGQAKLIQRQEEEKEDPVQAKFIQKQEEEKEDPAQAKLIQREVEEKEDPTQAKLIQKQEEEKEDPAQARHIQKKGETTGPKQSGPNLESRLNSTRGQGSPLPEKTRNFMENGIGTDFSKVKIHTGDNAVQMNKELGAQAFTQGNNIYFNSGKYNPETSSGKHLLAHELTHTVQQNKSISLQTIQKAEPKFGAAEEIIKNLLNNPKIMEDLKFISISDASPDKFCKRFRSKKKARAWRNVMKAFFIPLIRLGIGKEGGQLMSKFGTMLNITILNDLAGVASTGFGQEVADLWERYLKGSKPKKSVKYKEKTSEIVKGFVNSKVTASHQEFLLKNLKERLPKLCRKMSRLRKLPANKWKAISVRRLFTKHYRNYPINYDIFTEKPGNIAGGVSGSKYGKDSRRLKGSVLFYKIKKGNVKGVKIKTNFRFIIKDAVDFCPGGAGASIEKILTIPLSRLEKTGLAGDVPFTVDFKAEPIVISLEDNIVKKCWKH